MSVKRIVNTWYIRSRLFGKQVFVSTPAATKTEARNIEMAILTSFRSTDFRTLDPKSREVALRICKSQGQPIPSGLALNQLSEESLTLWNAIDLFLNYPEIKIKPERDRYIICCVKLVEAFGKDRPVRSIWVPEIREYMAKRVNDNASPSTINREKGTLSKMFQVLIELRLIDVNPCRLVKNLSQKSEERQVYLSFQDISRIVEHSPKWFQSIVLVAYYTGMRRGEILELTVRQVDVNRRIIFLGPQNTKEREWKKIPIHTELVPLFNELKKVRHIGEDRLFLIDGKPPNKHSLKKPWNKAVKELGLEPKPRFHDLRHTWRANARRSKVDPQVAESILGHWFKGKTVNERYGRISDKELLDAIDSMTFDHGSTEIWTAREPKSVIKK